MMADILRKHYVELINDLRDQDYICTFLQEKGIFAQCTTESVLCEKTNARRNRALIDRIRCRFTSAFEWFCAALEETRQYELLQLMNPARGQPNAPPQTEPETVKNECKVCLSYAARIAFMPCGHLCCCSDCSKNLTKCPVCRHNIVHRMVIYM